MTTQTPYGPEPRQPDVVYPTAPPWAPQQQQPPPAGAPWAGGAPIRHGQLMVPYPELMHGAGRPKPPSWIPVAVITFLTMPFGAISAARRAGRARREGNARYPYWLAFGLTFGLSSFLALVTGALAVPFYLEFREGIAAGLLQSNLVHDGKVKTTGGATVTRATCTPTAARGSTGLRAYTCGLTLSDGRTATLRVVADRDGHWTTAKTK